MSHLPLKWMSLQWISDRLFWHFYQYLMIYSFSIKSYDFSFDYSYNDIIKLSGIISVSNKFILLPCWFSMIVLHTREICFGPVSNFNQTFIQLWGRKNWKKFKFEFSATSKSMVFWFLVNIQKIPFGNKLLTCFVNN